ncbi:MAG: hypothetical protein Rubg2KO_25200 [Rubricoccaceae bacterium]
MKTLSPARWAQVDALFTEALELADAERAAWLGRIEDAELRRAVQRLLAADADAPAVLDAEAADFAAPLLSDLPDLPTAPDVGHRLGAYRLDREIARGGMGRVYLATRADGQYEQQVALKVLRPGLDTDDTRRRFRTERQILASLDHPHIARLLDGGVTESGQPFLAMEVVEGQPIDVYCDEKRLSIEDRLRLFVLAADAVHHAHQRLVVHRDLKPSNLFVTADGTPKLLDFGIAKLLDAPDDAQTRTAQRWMTSAYAAPEQVLGETVTTATDVYQLGAVLYELLTGHRPTDTSTSPLASSTGLELAKSAEPDRPSAAVTRVTERTTASGTTRIDPVQVSEARRTQPERLRRTLRGDLDTIVLKALRPDPEDRYASAEALAEDIQRYLTGLPVRARTPTVGYRMRRFVRRHRVGVVASALVGLSLVGGLGAALWQAGVAVEARDRAETALDRSEATTAFMLGLFEASDPYWGSPGDTLTSYDLLAQGVERADALDNQPEVQAAVFHAIGVVYERLEQHERAEALLRRALALRMETLGEAHPDVASTMNQLAWLLLKEGDYAAAEPLFRNALAIRRAAFGNDHPDVALNLNDLAGLLEDTGETAAAEPLLREALDIRRRRLGERHFLTIVSTGNLGLHLLRTGDAAGAEPLMRETLAQSRSLHGDEHPEVAVSMNTLARVLAAQGDLAAAESLLVDALAMKRRLWGDEHTSVATSLHYLAQVKRTQGDLIAAELLAREALALRRRLLGDDHPRTASTLHELARLHAARGDVATADSLDRAALRTLRLSFGPEHPEVREVCEYLATLGRAALPAGCTSTRGR